MKYTLILGCLFLIGIFVGHCSDESLGKKIGETCLSHTECASQLCTLPLSSDASPPSDGGKQKECVEPNVIR